MEEVKEFQVSKKMLERLLGLHNSTATLVTPSQLCLEIKRKTEGWGSGSLVQHSPSMWEALGSISSASHTNTKGADAVGHVCSPETSKAEAGDSKFKSILSYRMRPRPQSGGDGKMEKVE